MKLEARLLSLLVIVSATTPLWAADYKAEVQLQKGQNLSSEVDRIRNECMEEKIIQPLWKEAYGNEFNREKNPTQTFFGDKSTFIARQPDSKKSAKNYLRVFTADDQILIHVNPKSEIDPKDKTTADFLITETLADAVVGPFTDPASAYTLQMLAYIARPTGAEDTDVEFPTISLGNNASGSGEITVSGSEEKSITMYVKSLHELNDHRAQTLRTLNFADLRKCMADQVQELVMLQQPKTKK